MQQLLNLNTTLAEKGIVKDNYSMVVNALKTGKELAVRDSKLGRFNYVLRAYYKHKLVDMVALLQRAINTQLVTYNTRDAKKNWAKNLEIFDKVEEVSQQIKELCHSDQNLTEKMV